MAKKQFKAESKRLLDLMIHSIYTNRDIFLRELISNSSDALDKLHYASLTDESLGVVREQLKISLAIDKDARAIILEDNGIGMSKEELEQNLGTIAKSGTRGFREELGDDAPEDMSVIGQFGVGFYSAFMVAKRVDVYTRKAGSEEAWHWSSEGVDGYTIAPCEKDSWGTRMVLTLKDDSEEEPYAQYLEAYTLSDLVKKYSDYIRYPIEMMMQKSRAKERPADAGEDYQTEWEEYEELETLNSMVPLWQRAKSKVTDEEYHNFYKETFNDYVDPAAVIHTSAEGMVSYKSLLFIPKNAPYDFYTRDFKKGLALYSAGVLIMDKCEDLLPEHFRFVRGVVDSQDFSLNISREMLQQTRELKVIRQNLEKKIKAELKRLCEDERETYETIWTSFGRQLKYGVVDGYGMNKDLLSDLLLFHSSHEGKLTSLNEYVSRMKEGQEYIYFSASESVVMASALPQCQQVEAAGFEVLYLTEEVDEFVTQTLRDFSEKQFKSVLDSDALPESEEEKKELEEKSEEHKDLLSFVQESLGERVKLVRLSSNLGSHAAALNYQGQISLEMEKYFAKTEQAMGMKAERVLEINPDTKAFALLKDTRSTDPERAANIAKLLYEQSLLVAGLPLENPTAFNELTWSLLS